MRVLFSLLILIGLCPQLIAQTQHSCAMAKVKAYERVLKRTRAGAQDNQLMERYDVHWYFLNVNIERNNTNISGSTTIGANVLSATDTFCFELNSTLTIDSILYNNTSIPFAHTTTTDICYAMPAGGLTANTNAYFTIYYQGDASVTGGSAIGDGFSTDSSPTWGNSVTWSLSEPYSAREWFPCKQFLQDKADSAWVYVTTNNQNRVGSNGILQGVDSLAGNKVRYRWKTNYIIDYYLISIAVAQYVEYKTYAYPTAMPNDSIEILNYIYNNPGTLPNFKNVIDSTAMMIEYFSDRFGLYPFYEEKYGHAMAPFSGGMEHQTMSSMGFFNFGLVAHELMHQWFGDYVTCATWKDIFINEGFASYGQYLAYEQFRGLGAARTLMQDVHDDVMDQPGGSIFFTDTTNVNRIFSGRLSYDKGNAVIHSLRFVLGDSVFFNGVKNFLTQYAFGTAGIDDFKTSMETYSGINLTDFFNQWIYGEGYPIFSANYFSDATNLYLRITHNTSSTAPLFITPLEIKCESILNGDTIIKVDVSSTNDTYKIPLSKLVNNIEIDPNNWILNDAGSISIDPTLIVLSSNPLQLNHSISIFPNPTTDLLRISNQSHLETKYSIMDISGKVLISLTNTLEEQQIDVQTYSTGIYLFRAENKNGVLVEKLLKR